MDREKQIEKMATIINEMDECNAYYYDKDMIEHEAFADANAIAKALYNNGYRKQSEGEWKHAYNSYPHYFCTHCNHLYNNKSFKYCPNCGAKMKVGE